MPIITGILAISFMFSTGFNSIISQLMGHADVNITKSYLKDFDDVVINDAMEKLLEEPSIRYAS